MANHPVICFVKEAPFWFEKKEKTKMGVLKNMPCKKKKGVIAKMRAWIGRRSYLFTC